MLPDWLKITAPISLMFFIAVTLFLFLISGVEPTKLFHTMREKNKKMLNDMNESVIKRSRQNGRFFAYTQQLIDRSNIRLLFPYNLWLHLLLCLIAGLFSYIWISCYIGLFAALAFGLVAMMIPFILLQLISDVFSKREKKNAVNFLIILKNFFKAGSNDIFQAFRGVTAYIDEPLKSYIDLMVYEYEHKVNALTCLSNFRNKLGSRDLKLYIDNLSICYTQGGDIENLTNTFIDDISKTEEEDIRQDTEDKILNYGLYVLLILNYVIIWWMIRGAYRHEILGSIWGQTVFTLDMLASGYIIFLSLKKD